MKTFIVNSWREVVSQKKKLDVMSKLLGREWRMLTDNPIIIGKYIFIKDGKLLLSVNGLSTYSTWRMATPSSIIMDEGVATFLYKVVHIDDNIIVLNLDGTNNFCFLINDASTSLANVSFEDIQWYLFRNCNVDILTPDQKQILNDYKNINICGISKIEEKEEDFTRIIILVIVMVILLIIMIGTLFAYSK